MSELTLVIGNKNYSSWSLRPWLLLKYYHIPFTEVRIPIYTATTKELLKPYSPSGKVPALKDGDLLLWDSLAICEYIAEKFPHLPMWPKDNKARALARSISAEMHSGFLALRKNMPMNLRKRFAAVPLTEEAEQDVQRVLSIWQQCREQYAEEGLWLLGQFSIADAMYAPIALRFVTYTIQVDSVSQAYIENLLALPALQDWISAARQEIEVIDKFEVKI